jgi:hypothetical protein
MRIFKVLLLSFSLLVIALTAQADPEILMIRQNADTVGLYDKFELQLRLIAECENPFDPDDIKITATFTAPSGRDWNIRGFYNYTNSRSMWMVRFSPVEKGTWSYVVNIKNRNGDTTSTAQEFVVVPSSYHGPLQVATNKRYLEHADGTPYYGVGYWYNDSYAGFNSGSIKEEELDKLKDLGVNFISTFITPLETYASGLGRYDQNICGRLDEVLKMLEDRDMQLSLNLWFHSYLSETVWGGGNVRWETTPYDNICEPKDFFSSEEAWKYQEKLYDYFIARWGYSRSLALWFVVDEVNGTDGWVSGDSLGAAAWASKVHRYFLANDPYRHLTTGTRSGGITQWWDEGYQIFDIANREIYEAQGFEIIETGTVKESENPLRHSYFNYAGQVEKLWDNYNKPAIIGETGWDHTFFEFRMPGYLAQYHNALWVSLARGTAMTPFWWSYGRSLTTFLSSSRITSIRRFTDEIPFSKLTNVSRTEVQVSDGDGFGIRSDQVVFGWAVNPDTDIVGETITVPDLKPGKYNVRLFHTWQGRFFSEEEVTTETGEIKIEIPVQQIERSHARYFGQDAAFILEFIEP